MAYTVDGELCVACGFCVGHCPEVFAFNAAGVAEAVDTATGEAAAPFRKHKSGPAPPDPIKKAVASPRLFFIDFARFPALCISRKIP